MSNHYATSVYHDGYLYGYHGRQEFNPSFRAVELRTGTVRWSEDRFHAGTVTLAGDRLLILRETGELILADASPDRVPSHRALAGPRSPRTCVPGAGERVSVRAERGHARLPRPQAVARPGDRS